MSDGDDLFGDPQVTEKSEPELFKEGKQSPDSTQKPSNEVGSSDGDTETAVAEENDLFPENKSVDPLIQEIEEFKPEIEQNEPTIDELFEAKPTTDDLSELKSNTDDLSELKPTTDDLSELKSNTEELNEPKSKIEEPNEPSSKLEGATADDNTSPPETESPTKDDSPGGDVVRSKVDTPQEEEEPDTSLFNVSHISVVEHNKPKDYVVFKVQTRLELKEGRSMPEGVTSEKEGKTLIINVWRRYSDFEQLRVYLTNNYPSYIVPPLPDKSSASQMVGKLFASDNEEFLSHRLSFLDIFLTRLQRLDKLAANKWFEAFLYSEKWREDSMGDFKLAENTSKALISSIFSRSPLNPHEKMGEIATYATKTQDFLTQLLKNYENIKKHRSVTLASVMEFSLTLHSWADVDQEQSSAFQFASGQIDTFQHALTKVEDDEELKLVGPAKEYIAYSESVKSVVRRQYLMSSFYDKAIEVHKAKVTAKERLDKQIEEAAKMNKPLGKLQEKLKVATQQMDEAKLDMNTKEKNLNKFTDEFLNNYKHYQTQRTVDFKAIFLNFSRSQYMLHNQRRDVWEKIHKNFKSIGPN